MGIAGVVWVPPFGHSHWLKCKYMYVTYTSVLHDIVYIHVHVYGTTVYTIIDCHCLHDHRLRVPLLMHVRLFHLIIIRLINLCAVIKVFLKFILQANAIIGFVCNNSLVLTSIRTKFCLTQIQIFMTANLHCHFECRRSGV